MGAEVGGAGGADAGDFKAQMKQILEEQKSQAIENGKEKVILTKAQHYSDQINQAGQIK